MPSKVAVVIPVYKAELNPLEQISLAQVRKVLGKYPLIFVAPEGKNFAYFAPSDKVVHFPPQFFKNVQTYSQLLMSPFFYEAFEDFEYILIYQLDAFVFYDALEEFCALGYDYIGAPRPYCTRRNFPDKRNILVGNGGFSLRRIKSHCKLLTEHTELVKRIMGTRAEDGFFAYCGAREDIDFTVPPLEIAAMFSVEYSLKHSLKRIGGLFPFGDHGWTKMSADFFVKALRKFGYDLRPLRNMMDNVDYRILSNSLINYACQRLNRRIQRGQSLMRYLPGKYFSSVYVIRHPLNILILTQLLLEDNSLSDKIFMYSPEEKKRLLRDLTPEKLPHLLICFDGGIYEELILAAEQKGFAYGKRVISFWREYLTRCEELFHNLGK